jgi:hypothetical protein
MSVFTGELNKVPQRAGQALFPYLFSPIRKKRTSQEEALAPAVTALTVFEISVE